MIIEDFGKGSNSSDGRFKTDTLQGLGNHHVETLGYLDIFAILQEKHDLQINRRRVANGPVLVFL